MTDAALTSYLHALAGRAPSSAFLELRRRVADGILVAEFLPAHAHDRQAEAILRRAAVTDVYVGCAPRVRRSGTKRDIEEIWVLWAECDGAEAADAVCTYDPSPAMIIGSGSGPNVHAYWPLSEPLSPRAAEQANLRLAHRLGADLACYDAARILRPPGTWNHKRHPPTPVRVVRMQTGRSFVAKDVIADAPEVRVDVVDRRWTEHATRDTSRDPLLAIPPALYVGHLLGTPVRPGRKTPCPFHPDARPSLHVYPTAARGWSCFSCRRGGSIYDLAAELWGMGTRGRDFIELRRQLTQRFGPELRRGPHDLER